MDDIRIFCKKIRSKILEAVHTAKSGHCGGSLSAVEILGVLYTKVMEFDPARPEWDDRDRFILSKGHAAPALYSVLAECGFFPDKKLDSLRSIGSMLQGHPDMNKTPGIDMSTGSLGMGLSNGIGMALSARLAGKSFRTYVLCGDGELNEGQVWEAMMAAVKFKLDNLVLIIDHNGVQLDGTTEEIMPLDNLGLRISSFGFQVIPCNGHSPEELERAFMEAGKSSGKPVAIIAKTIKGRGVSFMEGKSIWHGAPVSDDDYFKAKKELESVS